MSRHIPSDEPASLDDILVVLVQILDILSKQDDAVKDTEAPYAGAFDHELDIPSHRKRLWQTDLSVRLRHGLDSALGNNYTLRLALALHDDELSVQRNIGKTSTNEWNKWRTKHGYGPTPGRRAPPPAFAPAVPDSL